ncbi:hypothetical protein PROFUN_08681 [Planoprotostelium fungivorum]|uniref:WASH complex subunit strumpellin n=1 Tax=Planoprotostelium fungivorum TaxID=1890364 RepID=A0A2P6MQT0_9EUKA|nr:hypothetical protein PROFUN_08681 [Planoprotostelium fungivorum]
MAPNIDFLAQNNICGQTILRIVSRGNSIIAELLRLSDNIPSAFRLADKDKRYAQLIFDFQYLGKADYFEHIIASNAQLMDLDEEFRDNHVEILKRFYELFESIYKYIKDFTQYLEDLDNGVYIQHTLEGILLNNDGKQLLSEAPYLWGVILKLLDEKIEGVIRERMLISHLRYKGQAEEPLLDEVCKLLKSTGFIYNAPKRPVNYPEEYFSRIPISKNFLKMVVGRLRSDDIYNRNLFYPQPDHRSTALSTQASMLYIILYFVPEMLQEENAIMREIVDKHFPDNWVVPWYLGYTVDLTEMWEGYRAAKAAISSTTVMNNVVRFRDTNFGKIDLCLKQLGAFLTEGVLTEEYILDNLGKLLACSREANVTLRWVMLHVNVTDKKIKQAMQQADIDPDKILHLLLETAHFEYILKTLFQTLLNAKKERWEAHKKECTERMTELSEYFSGEKALTRVKKNETLMKWFQHIGTQIVSLDYDDFVMAGRKIAQLIQALVQVEEFHQIESSLQVKQFLVDTRNYLNQMLRIINIKEEVLVTLSVVGDLTYAWQHIHAYVQLMQNRIKKDPWSVLKLRATFLKLTSILQMPLVRINQAESPDLVSVSEYYSSILVAFVRKVLEIVPKSMFEILAQIIDLQTTKIKEIPTRIDRDKLFEFAQLDHRYALSKASHSVSVFTQGILAMNQTLIGIIKVEPKQLLEDGIRKELVLRISTALHQYMTFPAKTVEEFNGKLNQLAVVLDGIKRSFQYISDYVNVYGLKIWQEEFSRIINFNVEQECNSFLKKKVYDWQSEYQSVAIPIPIFRPTDDSSVNFIGRLSRTLLSLIDVRKTVYILQMSGWFENGTGREIVGMRSFDLLGSAVGIFGLSGLDKLLCFMIVADLQNFTLRMRREMQAPNVKNLLNALVNDLSPISSIPTVHPQKVYQRATQELSRLLPLLLDTTVNIGQLQLLRRQIAISLNLGCKLDSNQLYCAMATMNECVITEIEEHYLQPEVKPYPGEESFLLSELSKYLETAGINDPYTKIYITTSPIDNFAYVVFTFILSQVTKFHYSTTLSGLVNREKKGYDSTSFIVGIITLLKQFHSSITKKILGLLGQYVRANINSSAKDQKLTMQYPEDVVCCLLFVEDFCKLSNLERKTVEAYIPSYIFDNFNHSG